MICCQAVDIDKTKSVVMCMLMSLTMIRDILWVFTWIKGLSPVQSQSRMLSPPKWGQHHDVDFVEDQITV